MWHFFWLIPLGFLIGAYGTLIGAGGGFILMPVLLILYPAESREILASISLTVVFLNALSGSWAYSRTKRIDYKSSLLFSTATIPGAILGASTTALLPVRTFDAILGAMMLFTAVFLWLERKPANGQEAPDPHSAKYLFTRNITDANGAHYVFTYNAAVGVGISFFVGYVSSMLGIGGGIIHVPVLVYLLSFPVHIATATSHLMLAIMAGTGTLVHLASGVLSHGIHRMVFLGLGVLIGAQFGAKLSERVRGRWIIRGLALALGFAGIRILMMAM